MRFTRAPQLALGISEMLDTWRVVDLVDLKGNFFF
jgi:hypothetical protein